MDKKVVKFGGSSLADAGQFRKVADIINSDPARRFVVASAPGKRDSSDTKVTDMLYRCYDLASAGEDFEPQLSAIEERHEALIEACISEEKKSPLKESIASLFEELRSLFQGVYLLKDLTKKTENAIVSSTQFFVL